MVDTLEIMVAEVRAKSERAINERIDNDVPPHHPDDRSRGE